MGKFIDLTGQKFGRLVVKRKENLDNLRIKWICKCDCGNIIVVQGCHLSSKHTKSCGCYHKEIVLELINIHGMSNTRVYKAWNSMIQRCYGKNSIGYKNYRGRGIKVCDHWKDSFENFYKDMGNCPDKLTLDRIDNNGDYSLKNCRWITQMEQCSNKRDNIYYEYKGEKRTIPQLGRIYKINISTLAYRIRKGMSIIEAIETPININMSR